MKKEIITKIEKLLSDGNSEVTLSRKESRVVLHFLGQTPFDLFVNELLENDKQQATQIRNHYKEMMKTSIRHLFGKDENEVVSEIRKSLEDSDDIMKGTL